MLGHCLFLFLWFNGSDLSDEAVVAARNLEQSIHFHCKYNVLIRTQSHDSEKRKKTLQCLCICARTHSRLCARAVGHFRTTRFCRCHFSWKPNWWIWVPLVWLIICTCERISLNEQLEQIQTCSETPVCYFMGGKYDAGLWAAVMEQVLNSYSRHIKEEVWSTIRRWWQMSGDIVSEKASCFSSDGYHAK